MEPQETSSTPKESVDKSNSRIRQMFGEISPRYDFMNHFLSGGTDIYWRWKTVRSLPVDSNLPILDVCTGTGDLALAWWKRANKSLKRNIRIVGTDFTSEMLQLARRKQIKQNIPESGKSSLTFVEADTQSLPFASASFQIVSVAFGLRNVCNTRQGLSEMIRVCHPGGHVVVLEFSLPKNRWLRSAYQNYFQKVLPRIGQCLMRNRQSAYEYLPESVSEFPREDALVQLMEECGLESVQWKSLTMGIAAITWGRKPL